MDCKHYIICTSMPKIYFMVTVVGSECCFCAWELIMKMNFSSDRQSFVINKPSGTSQRTGPGAEY